MKQQGVGGYDSWGARPEPFPQIPANLPAKSDHLRGGARRNGPNLRASGKQGSRLLLDNLQITILV